ncbi:PucR family transcriptional regulator [Mycolicibacterium llatzerense]|nr:helix-turn-helix domain-containing protein [Mycolicibacterium llatzerense]
MAPETNLDPICPSIFRLPIVMDHNLHVPSPAQLPPIPADSPLRKVIEDRVDEIATELLHEAVQSIEWPTAIPIDHFDDEVVPYIVGGFLYGFALITEGRRVTAAEAATFVLPVAERHAEDGIPLPFLFTALHAGIRKLWEIVLEEATDGDAETIAALGMYLADLTGTISVLMTEVYQDSDFALRANTRHQLSALCATLIAGEPDRATVAKQVGIKLSERYEVLVFRVDADEPRTTHEILAARRRLRLANQVFYGRGASEILNTFDGHTGVILLPAPTVEQDADPQIPVHLRTLIDALSERLDVAFYAAYHARAELGAIPTAVSEADEITSLARKLGREPGVYQLTDILFEYQSTRPGPARDLLARHIAPLSDHPGLLQALQAHLHHGADRKAAAAELFIHPNTLTYRLRRIQDITGYDPTDPQQSRLLAAAMTVYAIDHAGKPTAATNLANPG